MNDEYLQSIPMDLIPIKLDKGCNWDWEQRRNYYQRYYPLLDSTAIIKDTPGRNDYLKWMECGNNIQVEL